MKMPAKRYDPIEDQLRRWKVDTASARLRKCVELVLRSMSLEAVYIMRTPKLQVAIVEKGLTWAWFPIYKGRVIVREEAITLQRGAKVLLTLSEDSSETPVPIKEVCQLIAHHFGHVLLYLRAPRQRNECLDADREATRCGLDPCVKNKT